MSELELEEVERSLRNAKGVPAADKLIKYLRLVSRCGTTDQQGLARRLSPRGSGLVRCAGLARTHALPAPSPHAPHEITICSHAPA